MVHNSRDERQVVTDAFDLERVESNAHLFDRSRTGFTPSAELCDHRVVIHADLAAFVDASIVTHDATRSGLPFNRRTVAG